MDNLYNEEYNELIEKARDYGSKEKWEKCVENFEKAFRLRVKIEDLLDCALAYLELDNSFKAGKYIDLVIKTYPEDWRGYYYKGLFHEELGEQDNALKCYLQAEEKDNQNTTVLFIIGKMYDDKDDKEKAKDYYERVLEIDENDLNSNLNLGSMYEQEGQLDKALKYTLKAYNNYPNEGVVNYNLGVIYEQLGKYEEALKAYQRELENEEPFEDTWYNIGSLYKDQFHDYENAKKYLLQGLAKNKDDSSCWYNLGCLYVNLNNYEEAKNCFHCAILIDSDIKAYMEEDPELVNFLKVVKL